MNFNFDNFTKVIHQQFVDETTLKEVRDLLSLEEGYSTDSPISTGKRLLVNNLYFNGIKPDETEQFEFQHEFKGGVNLIIASNLRGKSSVFKIIKFALTGKKPENIRTWIKHILLNFSINEIQYSIFIDTSGKTMYAKLLNGKIEAISLIDDLECLWEAKGQDEFEDKINKFFFTQFSYYNLKWTQKSPQKDSNDLLEVNASWATYFSSIYLESKDSYTLAYGAQETKVFEMLMGLELTYPINRLKIRLEKLQNEQVQKIGKSNKALIQELEEMLKQKKAAYQTLTELNSQTQPVINTSELYAEYDRLVKSLDAENNRILSAQQTLNLLCRDEYKLNSEIEELVKSRKNTSKEKESKERKKIELNEYLKSKLFFFNLDIHHCPNCNHTVSETKKNLQTENHTCSLCSEPLSENEVKYSIDNINNKIKELELLIPQFETRIQKITSEIDQKNKSLDNLTKRIESIKVSPSIDLEATLDRIKVIEQQINEYNSTIHPKTSNKEEIALIKEIGNIEGQLLTLRPNENNVNKNFELYRNIIEFAIGQLKHERRKISISLMEKLRALMLSEIERFGLRNISDIVINDDMSIRYIQHNEPKKFDNFVEGEQLRLKMAFYLSLIQLDVNENYGRHTMFLIVDSPTKEEADDEYLGGLMSVLKDINTLLGDKIQILIGTANRDFEDEFENQLVIPQGKYVF